MDAIGVLIGAKYLLIQIFMETGRKNDQSEIQAGDISMKTFAVEFFVTQFSRRKQITPEQAAQVRAELAEKGPDEAQKTLDGFVRTNLDDLIKAFAPHPNDDMNKFIINPELEQFPRNPIIFPEAGQIIPKKQIPQNLTYSKTIGGEPEKQSTLKHLPENPPKPPLPEDILAAIVKKIKDIR